MTISSDGIENSNVKLLSPDEYSETICYDSLFVPVKHDEGETEGDELKHDIQLFCCRYHSSYKLKTNKGRCDNCTFDIKFDDSFYCNAEGTPPLVQTEKDRSTMAAFVCNKYIKRDASKDKETW